MIDFKKQIAKSIAQVTNLEETMIEEYIEIPPDRTMGDYAFPCFRLAKELKKAPPVIANEIQDKIVLDTKIITKTEVVGGYLNFMVNPSSFATQVIDTFSKTQESYGSSKIGSGKTMLVEYSSPNIAKPFHIGHLRTTVIGASLYRIYQYLGYHTVGINHIGDWGTQFGKMIEGYKRWGDEYDIEKNPIDDLTSLYVRINQACKEDEKVLEACRDNFKKLEEKDPYCTQLWERFRTLSLKEFQRIYDLLNIQFDSWNGEAFYGDKMPEVMDRLEKSGKLIKSEGAKIIELEEKNMAPCIIEKTNGSTTYATRDLAAILYRAKTYDFDQCLYIVAYEQNLHFKQVFEAAKLLGLDEKYINGLEHISFGMIRLKSGKMSTREGTVIKLEELLKEAIQRAKEIIEQKEGKLENKEEIAKKVGIGAVIFNDLYNNRIKDEVFDWDVILNFQGETGPYVQYVYVRTKSVLDKVDQIPEVSAINKELLTDEASMKILKLIYAFSDVIQQAGEKREPYLISRYLIDLAQSFSSYYHDNKIIQEEKSLQDARIYLTYMVGTVLKAGTKLLGMEMPDRM